MKIPKNTFRKKKPNLLKINGYVCFFKLFSDSMWVYLPCMLDYGASSA